MTKPQDVSDELVTEVSERNGWPEDSVREAIAAGRLMVGLDGCCAILPEPEPPKSATEVAQSLKREAQRQGRIAAIRTAWSVFVRPLGSGLEQNFAGSYSECQEFAEEYAAKSGLAIFQGGANAKPDTFAEPGIYLAAQIYDELAPNERRCMRSFHEHY